MHSAKHKPPQKPPDIADCFWSCKGSFLALKIAVRDTPLFIPRPHSAHPADSLMTDIAPSLFENDLHISVSTYATGWQTAITRPPKIRVNETSLKANKPPVISIRVGRTPLKTTGFLFPEGEGFLDGVEQPVVAKKTKPAGGSKVAARKSQTRMKPPGDIIKLRDRLYYVLQPPLESLMSSQCLEFPFEPFPYQFEGIAFLFPRYSAILADEMGLGKTMQAISTIRMLLSAGEVRNILLICPKPLVTNWVREFALWAPEVAVGVIEGDATKREWQWRQEATPVKIANYELLMRDREVVCDGGLHFDIAVLDEAQRIKNKSSTTSQVVKSLPRSRSWALTGTPVENSPDDLVGISSSFRRATSTPACDRGGWDNWQASTFCGELKMKFSPICLPNYTGMRRSI